LTQTFKSYQAFQPPIALNGHGQIYWGLGHGCTKLIPYKEGDMEYKAEIQDFHEFPDLAKDFSDFYNQGTMQNVEQSEEDELEIETKNNDVETK
jgi:hypothetical protein